MKYILQFLEEWLEWAKNDAPYGSSVFDPENGLCDNLNRWLYYSPLSEDECYEITTEFSCLLEGDFPDEGGMFPFGSDDFYKESASESHHRNESRLRWVEGKIEELSRLS